MKEGEVSDGEQHEGNGMEDIGRGNAHNGMGRPGKQHDEETSDEMEREEIRSLGKSLGITRYRGSTGRYASMSKCHGDRVLQREGYKMGV